MTSVSISPGHCAIHGYHGMNRCPQCGTGNSHQIISGETAALNAIAAALHRIADALEKENP